MAFIGPRPERKFYIDQIMEHDARYPYLYQIRPGVTSYATLYNGYTDTMEKMVRRLDLDLYYLEHRSWWFDTKILAKTFINIVFGKKFWEIWQKENSRQEEDDDAYLPGGLYLLSQASKIQID